MTKGETNMDSIPETAAETQDLPHYAFECFSNVMAANEWLNKGSADGYKCVQAWSRPDTVAYEYAFLMERQEPDRGAYSQGYLCGLQKAAEMIHGVYDLDAIRKEITRFKESAT